MNKLSFMLEVKKLAASFQRLSKECDLDACLKTIPESDKPFAIFSACDMFDASNHWYIDFGATPQDVTELIREAYNSLNL